MKKKLLLAVLILSCSFLNLFLRAIYPPAPPVEANLQPSIIVTAGLLIPVFTGYTLIVYSGIAFCFFLVQKKLRFDKAKKGIMYGLSIGGIWIIGMFESCSLFGNSLIYELVSGLIDAFPIILFSIGLSGFASPCSVKKDPPGMLSIFLIALSFTVFRFVAYTLVGITSGIDERFVQTLVWTISMGLMVGIMYYMLNSKNSINNFKDLLKYSFLIYGVNLFLFNFALILIIDISLYDLLARTLIDIIAVIIGIYVSRFRLPNNRFTLEADTRPVAG